MAYVRGSNPVWSFVDLTGRQCDDTFYMFVLENELPYIPATVWHDANAADEWTNPIQFLANGTLPVDIYWDPDVVYRLEIRKGDSQSDPLIYLIENYIPGQGGSQPIDAVGLFTDNQLTNPQFSLISFSSPTTFTSITDPAPIEVAPGWFLELTGTGNVFLERIALNSAQANPTNAPYALHITLSGTWTGTPKLRQRLQQNGMLWANKYVSTSLTAKIQGAATALSVYIQDSMGMPLAQLLDVPALNETYNQYQGYALLPDTTNTDTPPDAYIDYQVRLPTSIDLYITSLQVVVSDIANNFEYEQDTIDRQIDHTFHYYKDSLIIQPKETVLCGWNFPLNPWQSLTTGVTTLTTNRYTADQTIVIQQNYVATNTGSNISVNQGTAAQRQGFAVNAVTATNQFALLQYVDPATIRPYWNHYLSSLVRARIFTSNGSNIRFKIRLIVNNSLPGTVTRIEPIASWTSGQDPTLQTGWSYIEANNDPIYTFENAYSSEGAESFPYYPFDSFLMPNCTSSTQTLGILLYTLDDMSITGTPDQIVFDKISLVPISFAIDSTPITFDDELRRLQYYYEQSYKIGDVPGTATSDNAIFYPQFSPTDGSTADLFLRGFTIPYKTIKRGVPAVVLYDVSGGNLSVSGYTYVNGSVTSINGTVINAPSTNWSVRNSSTKSIYYTANRNSAAATTVTVGNNQTEGLILFHYTANARLGA